MPRLLRNQISVQEAFITLDYNEPLHCPRLLMLSPAITFPCLNLHQRCLNTNPPPATYSILIANTICAEGAVKPRAIITRALTKIMMTVNSSSATLRIASFRRILYLPKHRIITAHLPRQLIQQSLRGTHLSQSSKWEERHSRNISLECMNTKNSICKTT